jgi:DNA-binding transcriptional LysR family regulator
MSRPSLDQLDCFADVVELGSFSAAAARRNVTQPAVSLQLRQLERRLGVRLIERIGKRVQPTPAGRDLLAHVRCIQEAVASAVDAVAPHQAGRTGRIRIGTGATACIYLLPPVLRRLRERMPLLEITVRTGNTPEILKLLEENAIDLALVTLPAQGRTFDVTVLCKDELIAVFPAAGTTPESPATPSFLAERPLVLYESGGNARRTIDAWFLRAGLSPKPVMELGSVEAIKELVGAGLGCAVLPTPALTGPGAREHIVTRSLAPRLFRTLGLVLRRDKRLDRGLQEVVSALKALAA